MVVNQVRSGGSCSGRISSSGSNIRDSGSDRGSGSARRRGRGNGSGSGSGSGIGDSGVDSGSTSCSG